jgi:hypothetical protein
MDLDQSGFPFQKVNTWLGPTLGWSQTRVKPERIITVGGTYNIIPDDGVVLVNVAATVTLFLPDVRLWLNQPASQPAPSFERSIWIKDLGGNAASFAITVMPYVGGGQRIDQQISAALTTNFQMLRLYPISDFSGWFVG